MDQNVLAISELLTVYRQNMGNIGNISTDFSGFISYQIAQN